MSEADKGAQDAPKRRKPRKTRDRTLVRLQLKVERESALRLHAYALRTGRRVSQLVQAWIDEGTQGLRFTLEGDAGEADAA